MTSLVLFVSKKWRRFFEADGDHALWSVVKSFLRQEDGLCAAWRGMLYQGNPFPHGSAVHAHWDLTLSMIRYYAKLKESKASEQDMCHAHNQIAQHVRRFYSTRAFSAWHDSIAPPMYVWHC